MIGNFTAVLRFRLKAAAVQAPLTFYRLSHKLTPPPPPP
jgi:hypothetical protein